MLVQTNSSNLVDAYKWTELDASSGLAMFALCSGITDRAEPSESLRTHVAYGLGLNAPTVLLSSLQLEAFRRGLVPDSVMDAAVGRVLRAKFELGLFEEPFVDVERAAREGPPASSRTACASGSAFVSAAIFSHPGSG